MLSQLKRLLTFLRLTDLDGTLSITSLVMLVILYKVATSACLNFAELGAFLTASAVYQSKKFMNQNPGSLASVKSELQELKAQVQMVENRTLPPRR